MKNKVITIIGSSRSDGDTKNLINELERLSDFESIDLNDYKFSYYDYEHKNANDDYIKLIKRLIENYDTFLFATPVYWYAMSGIMKVFFDRITDLLDNEKELGRQLRKKKMAVITCSIGDNLGDNFWLPFKETSKYLGMHYIGNLHTISNKNNETDLKEFIRKIDGN
jgi:multimeric flavodoxin WrbA